MAGFSTQTPSLTPSADDNNQRLLYRPVPYQAEPPAFSFTAALVTPEQAQAWFERSHNDPSFANRSLLAAQVRRWKLLLETDRFVHYLPDGPLLIDESGILLNGWHRLNAVVGYGKPVGFCIVGNVPRWMMRFFDTGKSRRLNDLFQISRRMTRAQTGATARLSMRYEEFLYGKRKPLGWKTWSLHRDELTDVDDFLGRREPLGDLYGTAEVNSRTSRLVISALMTFRFYQELAWPEMEGERQLTEFWDALSTGAAAYFGDPANTLRAWARDLYYEKQRITAKREAQLMLLYRHFAARVNNEKIGAVRYGYGQPMLGPFHPGGPQAAVDNVKAALEQLEREAATAEQQQQQGPGVVPGPVFLPAVTES